MLNEPKLRRGDFLIGISIRLADGQVWTLPRPSKNHAVDGNPTPVQGASDNFGPEYPALIKAFLEAEDEADRLQIELALAILFLGRNYILRPEDYQVLLHTPASRGILEKMQEAFHRLALEHARVFQIPTLARIPSSIARDGATYAMPGAAMERLSCPGATRSPGALGR